MSFNLSIKKTFLVLAIKNEKTGLDQKAQKHDK